MTEMSNKAIKAQEELDKLDEDLKMIREKQKQNREVLYSELGKAYYKASGAKSYQEAFSKLDKLPREELPGQEDVIDQEHLNKIQNYVSHMNVNENGDWRLPYDELQKFVNEMHEIFG